MVAKMVLPLLGGSPMVWNTCMVFFQIALLVGYAYAHGATRLLDGRVQVALHVALLVLPFSVLPFLIGPDTAPPTAGAPIAWLLLLLARCDWAAVLHAGDQRVGTAELVFPHRSSVGRAIRISCT